MSQGKRQVTKGDKKEAEDDGDVGSLTDSLKFASISSSKSGDGKPHESDRSQQRPRGSEKEESLSTQASQPSAQAQTDSSGPDSGSDRQDRQEQKIKFLIQVPMWVPVPDEEHSEERIMSKCQNLLDLLERTGFNEDQDHLKDVAIIIGLNGEEGPSRRDIIKKLEIINEKTDLMFKKVSFTWGHGGNIPHEGNKIPYCKIREHLKNREETKQLVRELRGNDDCLVYFSFIDADTVDFNRVYSSYLEIVNTYIEAYQVPPTVMSTGYEFSDPEFQRASQIDREMRIRTAEHFPLGTYYPEPNFCVLLPKDKDTLPESFINKSSKLENMESAILIRDVKKRTDIPFAAIFPRGQPIVTPVPPGSKLKKDEVTTQCHHNPYIWATGAYTHKELRYEPARGLKHFYNIRAYLVKLLRCTDTEFEEICANFWFTGPGCEQVKKAARAAREFRLSLKTEQ